MRKWFRDLRFPYNDQRKMIGMIGTGCLSIAVFLILVHTLWFVPSWFSAGAVQPWWFLIVGIGLSILRLTIYRNKSVEENNQYS